MKPVRLELLGGFRLSTGAGATVEIAARKNRGLLGILAMAPRLEATRERLMGLLWSDRGEQQSRNSLRQALTALRKDLAGTDAGFLAVGNDRIGLDPERIEVDVAEFLAASSGSDPADLRRAAALYAGPFLDGLSLADAAFEDWLRDARGDLHSKAIRALGVLVDRLAAGEAVAFAERLVALDPLREASQLALMRAHGASGQRGLAVRQYEAFRLLLKRELGVTPGAEIESFRHSLDAAPADSPAPREQSAPAPDRRIAIAVLPFANMSGDPAQQYLADGITEDIITELSRFGGLSVAPRLASFHFAAQGGGPAEIAARLGARFVVDGSVRKAGERIRVTAQLIDAASGSQVWAERYDRAAEDVFAVLDEAVAAIVAMMEDRMVTAGAASARRKPVADWSAYDCLLQGRELCNEYREPEAVALLERAVAIDPGLALAHAWLAIALTMSSVFKGNLDRIARAEAAARRALELDGDDSTAHYAAAIVQQWSGDIERARAHFERAMTLNPADIQIRGDYANWQRMSGRPEEALATIDKAIGLGPFVPRWFATVRGETLFDLRRYAEAVEALESVPQHYLHGLMHLAAARACLGDAAGAASAVERARTVRPDLTVNVARRLSRYSDAAVATHLFEALRRAGLPE